MFEGFKIDYNKKNRTDLSSYKNFLESFLIDRLELKILLLKISLIQL